MGAIINTAAVAAGSLVGLLFKKRMRESLSEAITSVMGFCVVVVGLLGLITNMVSVKDGALSSEGTLLLIVSMALGLLAGELMGIEDRLNAGAKKLEEKCRLNNFAQGFLSASLLFCIGAMTIVGCLRDGLSHDPSVLILKSALDGIMAIFLTAAMGVGVMFSAVAVLVLEGGLTIAASFVAVYISGEMIANVCMVGYGIVFLIGTNLMGLTKIKTANLLPALLISIVWTLAGLGRI